MLGFRWCGLLFALAPFACGKRSPSEETPRIERRVPAPTPSALGEAIALPAIAAGVPSVPRKDWPCRAEVRATDMYGEERTDVWTYTYGALSSCMVPLEVHVDGIVGCPSEVLIEDPTAKDEPYRERLVYDQAGHLLEYADALFRWEGDKLVADALNSFEVRDGMVDQRMNGRVILRARAEGNLLTQLDLFDAAEEVTGVSKVKWSRQRMLGSETRSFAIPGFTRITAFYDCPAR